MRGGYPGPLRAARLGGRPAFRFRQDDFWAHGLNAVVEFRY